MRMDEKTMLDLITRIKTEPSVLFLGQDYLRSLSGQDCFYDAVNRALCRGKAPSAPSYQNIWDHVNGGQPLQQEHFHRIYQTVCDLPALEWLRGILSMRWGMVFTSAVDACLTHCVGPNFTFNALSYDKTRFKREYMSKSSLHGVYLYGSVDGSGDEFPPHSCDPKTMRGLKKRVSDRIGWIYNEILRDYGVLVIDGWDPERDWLSFLLDNAGSMPYHSIYLFGATPGMLEDETISGLVEDEILTCYPQTFARALDEYGYFQSADTAWDSASSYEGGKTVTIRSRRGRDISLNIPLSALDVLDTRITLLDDDLGYENHRRDVENRSEAFARYLQQNSPPVWSLCTLQAGFHFSRGIDEELFEAAKKLLQRAASYRRGLLILEGVSNSGKTSTLVHYAMRMREEHRYPIFYISGAPTQTAFSENLKTFIKRYLQSKQDSDGAWVERVIVLWDGNLSSDAVRQYVRLSQDLTECNALVIGTTYRHDSGGAISGSPSKEGIRYIPIQATLTKDERRQLGGLLRGIDPLLYDRFKAAVDRVSEPNLIYLLQRISKYQYSQEWKAVYKILKDRFDAEVDRSEFNTQRAMENFRRQPEEEEVHEEIIRHGVGAAWQLKLEEKLKEMLSSGEYQEQRSLDQPASPEEGGEQSASAPSLLEDVRLLNQALAVAGQFSVPMPVALLLNMIHRDGGMLSRENLFLNSLLENDSLVDYTRDEEGYPFVRFRHPKEAELYVEKNFGGDPAKRRRQEVDLLCKLIAACRWNEDEAYDVIRLIRCFGPNSEGKYSQDISHGDYTDYLPYLPDIADCLLKHADEDPEAMLVYAHFLRETYSDHQRHNQPNDRDYLGEAKNKLRVALERHDQQNRQQYNRLVVEVCSNLVASMPRSGGEGVFNRDTFHEFQNNFQLAINTWDSNGTGSFTTNSLLDIWLNAIGKFHSSFASDEEAARDTEFPQALSNSMNYIDLLLELSADFSSTNLLEKVDRVYKWASKGSMEDIRKRLEAQGNDTFLYLTARRCWLADPNASISRTASAEEIVRQNLFLLPDDADAHAELSGNLPGLRKRARKAAERAIAVLEERMDLIQRSRSSRCVHMLIRAKWLTYTGRMPLEEKQQPGLSDGQWEEIYQLCRRYSVYCAYNGSAAQNLETYLQAVYLWSSTTDVGQARTLFSQLRQQMGSNWFVERLGLCVPGQKRLRTFYVDVQQSSSGNFNARISEETTSMPGNVLDLRGRFGIHISDYMMAYLFDGQAPCSRYRIQKPVTLWFTATGPTLGLAPNEKEGLSE